MDIDASQKMQPLPFSCYRCGKAWHKAADCPTRFDIRELSIDDLQPYLEDHLAELNVNLHKHGFCDFCLLFQHKSLFSCAASFRFSNYDVCTCWVSCCRCHRSLKSGVRSLKSSVYRQHCARAFPSWRDPLLYNAFATLSPLLPLCWNNIYS